MNTLLEMLEKDFDVVLCDAPPLLPVTDAAILARVTSGALLIISAGRTTKHQLQGPPRPSTPSAPSSPAS
jgi:Mrp family chromosome partitioning ATPase